MGARVAEGVAVLLFYSLATLVLFHPLFADPANQTLAAGWVMADIHLTMWILSWDWHAITTSPASFWDPNAFYPAVQVLAGSEHMLGHLLVFGPVYALSGNPILAYQLNIFAALSLSGAAMYALLRHWGVGRAGALFGGFVYAFCPARAYGLLHAHLMPGQYLPLALLYLDRTIASARVRPALAAAFFLSVQILTSYYTAYGVMIALLGYGAGVLWATRGRLRPAGVVVASLAVLGAFAVLAGVSGPYIELQAQGVVPDIERERIEWIRAGAAHPLWTYLTPPALITGIQQSISVYVGFLPLLFAMAAFLPRRTPGSEPERWSVAATFGLFLACWAVSLGPSLEIGGLSIPLPYQFFVSVVPGFSTMRVLSRLGIIAMLGVAALAGLGAGRLFARVPAGRAGVVGSGVALAALLVGTAFEYDFPNRAFPTSPVTGGPNRPEVYRALDEHPIAPVLEIPAGGLVGEIRGLVWDSEAMMHSIGSWYPLLNGYTGYYPPSYVPLVTLARALPDEKALELLVRSTGLRYVVVHRDRLMAGDRARWNEPEGLELLGTYGQDALFRVADPPEADLLEELLRPDGRTTTLTGTPLAPLSDPDRQARIEITKAPKKRVFAAVPFEVDLLVQNLGGRTWPALAPVDDGRIVTVGFRWLSDDGEVFRENPQMVRLPFDLEPGQSVHLRLGPMASLEPSSQRLVMGLVQNGEWFPATTEPIPLTVRRANLPSLAKRARPK